MNKNAKLLKALKGRKSVFIVGKALSHTVANTVTDLPTLPGADRISRLLGMKFWFGGKMVYPWDHPMNKVQNACAITLDGCMQYKFKVHKNGKLRVMKIGSGRFLALGLKPLQTITMEELYNRIAGKDNKLAGSYMQLTSPVPIPVDVAALRELEMERKRVLQTA